jgi:5-methylcytosine-specific restriction endonuclease McrA
VGQISGLKPGAAFCLRRFSTLLANLVRSAWLEEVRSNPKNSYLVGERESLETFLFGRERIDAGAIRDVMCEIQSNRCFYCATPISSASQLDHFIPWASYPSNLGHNLVLAHAGCNGDKSDLLADVEHLNRWWQRNDRDGAAIGHALTQRGVVADLTATKGIAKWAYSRARAAGALLWISTGSVRPFPVDAQMPF